MPLFSTLNPALRTLLPTIGFIYALQAVTAVPSIYFQSDRFYDLSGSLTYLSCTVLSLYFPALRARSLAASQGFPTPAWPKLTDFHPRQLILSGLTAIWAARRMLNLPHPKNFYSIFFAKACHKLNVEEHSG